MSDVIQIRGVRQNNLKGWDLDIPVGQWVTVTGVSGSGKSTFAVDVLYAEGQRRYVETFSPYARQFLERMDRPLADDIRGIPPALAIESHHPVRTSRSTVGTMTELTDFLKLLFARLAVPYCSKCGSEISRTTPDSLLEESRSWPKDEPWMITFPLMVAGRDEEEIRAGLLRMGFFRIWKDGHVVHIDDWRASEDENVIDVLVDRIVPESAEDDRMRDSMETAFRYGGGDLFVYTGKGLVGHWSTLWKCPGCGEVVRDPSPNLFSFNSPVGACETCRGFGRIIDIDPELVVPDPSLSVSQGAVRPLAAKAARREGRDLRNFCKRAGIPMDVPWRELAPEQQTAILEGSDGYYGVKGLFRRLESKAYKMHVRVFLSRYRGYFTCPDCLGKRLQPEALRWKIGWKTLPEVWTMDVQSCLRFFDSIVEEAETNPVVHLLVTEIIQRLSYLRDVGLGYLTLDRASRTLSGGEVERVLLTRALGSRLVSTLFVLDEPSVGLHPRDTDRLSKVIRNLVNQGNTAVIVEHDPDLILKSDRIIDLGPGAGSRGGQLLFADHPALMNGDTRSVTGRYLTGKTAIPVPERRRPVDMENVIVVKGVSENNLKSIDVHLPLGILTCITGVSGSGKSTLLLDVLYRALLRAKGIAGERPGKHEGLSGAEHIDRVELIDQSAVGRTPRANAATYTKAWDTIRKIFAAAPDARKSGWKARDFSFNVQGGRCESCKGDGFIRVEMQFLSDVLISCPDCRGRRFRGGYVILDVRHKGKSIADVLEMTVDEAAEFFGDRPRIPTALTPLQRLGLGYLSLGQPLSTLSGGEAQRLKLARFLTDKPGHAMFLLDEPTTGLHLDDVRVLLDVLNRLVDEGNTVVVVEHHLDVVKCADRVIDLGPEGGDGGGRIVGEGAPEEIAGIEESHTGRHLKTVLEKTITVYPEGPPEPEYALAAEAAPLPRPVMKVIGAREHNLKDIAVDIPRNSIVAITGVSGSGKSTLAFDILFAEGQRRYLESLPAYVRQYLKVLDRPDVDIVAGVPPTVSIEQRTARAGRRSTVATLTEVYHFLRLLYARLGEQYCTQCDIPISQGGVEGILRAVMNLYKGRKIDIFAPIVVGRKGFHKTVFQQAKRRGVMRVRVDGEVWDLDKVPALDRYREHWIDWATGGGLKVEPAGEKAVRLGLENGLSEGQGVAIVVDDKGIERTYSRKRQCPSCGKGFDELDPRHFSFNSTLGGCPKCDGIGVVEKGERYVPCGACGGARLNQRALSVKIQGLTIAEMTAMTVSRAQGAPRNRLSAGYLGIRQSPNFKGSAHPARNPGKPGRRLPHPGPVRGNAFGRRSSAHPACCPVGFQPARRPATCWTNPPSASIPGTTNG